MKSLEDITTKLGNAYEKWKQYEKDEKKLKEDFFHAAVQQYDDPILREEWVDATSEQEALKVAKKKFPEYFVTGFKKGEGGTQYLLSLEENLNFRPFIYVNHSDKMVYKKTIQTGSALLDDKAIKDEDPELWMKITREPVKRELIPLDELPDDIIVRMQKYVYRSSPIVKLDKPRKATDEELEV